MSTVSYCRLDSSHCLSLKQVVNSFCAPIKEEHAWAILHQGVLALLQVSDQPSYLVRFLDDILISDEGHLHARTFTRDDLERLPMSNLATGVAELGVVVYEALDWSVTKDSSMERRLSTELENVLDVMTSADDLEMLDEGIGEEEVASRLCEKVLELCRHHLALPGEAAEHYQQVCRAVVAEALELSSLMSRLSSKDLEELESLDRQDWAGIFNQVMGELRSGIKLRKVDYSRTPTEFSMTPYEMLMDEVQSKKVVLKKPVFPVHVEKAARDQILDFIRSRPTLKPAAERKLNEPTPDECPAEILMNEIRGGRARQSLRRTKVRRKKEGVNETFGKVVEKVMLKDKKFINLDDSFASTIFNFEESPDNSLELVNSSPEPCSKKGLEPCLQNDGGEVFQATRSVTTPQPSQPTKETSPRDFTLEEVSHMRSQITVAELQQLDLSNDKWKDYVKGRICFLCAKTRFGIFFWAYPCQLCKRQVCKNCCDKIKLPSHKMSEISVSSLRSQLKSSAEDETVTDAKKSPFGRGWQRCSLKYPATEDKPKLTRSKTLTKAETERVKERAASASSSVGISHTVCTDCRDLLASMVWGKKGPKSPKKKTIFDLQSMTIRKRKMVK
eukprot:GFUD01018270.1.p1 GENE.GFUD01018270.1~~GFUD01018270.1.p1  ORF type:complete len:616 (+),score=121.73 GFUD01018270.1:128-1975(+)